MGKAVIRTKIDCEMLLYHYVSNRELPKYDGLMKRFLFDYCKNEEDKMRLLYIYYYYFMDVQPEISIFRKIFYLQNAVEDNQCIEFLIGIFQMNHVSMEYIGWLEQFLEVKKIYEREEIMNKIDE